jgi:hypothetical protein
LSLSQNYSIILSTLPRSIYEPAFPDDLFYEILLLFSFSREGLRFLGVVGVAGAGVSLV